MAETGGSRGAIRTKRKAKRKKASSSRHGSEEDAYAEFAHDDDEQHDPNYVPSTDLKTCELKIWTNLRQDNPYVNDEQPFTEDRRFWTKAQFAMWEQFYAPAVPEPAVKPRRLNVDFHNMYKHDDFKYVDMALKKMNLWTLVTLEQDYISDLVSQFFCTAYFHPTPQRHITFMVGTTQCSISYDQFQTALGYTGNLRGGFRIHSEGSMSDASLAFCYPSAAPVPAIPQITAMYYFYNTMAKIYRCTIVSKAGDFQACRRYAKNLMFYTHPNNQQKIDVPDYIYNELKRAVEKRMLPNYAPYVMCLLYKAAPATVLVGRRERHALLDLPLRHDTPEPPYMCPAAGSTGPANRRRPDPSMASSSSSVQPKKGAAKFFKSLFQMCKHSYDVNSKALRLAQSNRELIIEDFRARGLEVPENPPEMAPLAHFNYRMPPLDDAMFAGYSGTDIQEEEKETSEES